MKYKQEKAWAVMMKGEFPNKNLRDFIFKDKQSAIEFAGKQEADIIEVLIRPIEETKDGYHRCADCYSRSDKTYCHTGIKMREKTRCQYFKY